MSCAVSRTSKTLEDIRVGTRADRSGSGRLEQLFTRNAFFIACFSGTVNLSAEDRDRVECCWAYAAAATPVISAQSSKALVRAAGRTHCRPSICFAARPWLTMIPRAASISSIIRRLSTIRTQSTKFDSRWRCRLPVGPWRSHADCDRHYPADQGRVLAVDRAFLSKGCARCSIISALRRCQPGPFARFAFEPATVLSGSITLIASCCTTLCRLPRRAPSLVATTTPRG
jgi:hypothetical protein